MSVEQIKAELIQAACALAAGVIDQAAPSQPVKADPLIQDLGLQNENIFAYVRTDRSSLSFFRQVIAQLPPFQSLFHKGQAARFRRFFG
jgi:hypothetical protein